MAKININPVGFKTDSKLDEFIIKKLEKLTPLHEKIEAIDVNLKLEAKGKNNNKVADIRFIIPGEDIFVKKQSDTFEGAIDECAETLRRQLIKRKEKTYKK
ncbi:MAG: HPF/RaiA family ribosome-associated protein [Bacteroidales bacterium]|jgi:putative sigma-54 modulation protein